MYWSHERLSKFKILKYSHIRSQNVSRYLFLSLFVGQNYVNYWVTSNCVPLLAIPVVFLEGTTVQILRVRWDLPTCVGVTSANRALSCVAMLIPRAKTKSHAWPLFCNCSKRGSAWLIYGSWPVWPQCNLRSSLIIILGSDIQLIIHEKISVY